MNSGSIFCVVTNETTPDLFCLDLNNYTYFFQIVSQCNTKLILCVSSFGLRLHTLPSLQMSVSDSKLTVNCCVC